MAGHRGPRVFLGPVGIHSMLAFLSSCVQNAAVSVLIYGEYPHLRLLRR